MAARKTPSGKAPTSSSPSSAPLPPLPPDDLHKRTLDVVTLSPQEVVRISWEGEGLFWSPEPGKAPRARFDAPGGEYQVHYSALCLDGAFVEALLRQEQPPILTWSDIKQRELFTLRLTRTIRVMPIFGPQLRQMGGTAAVASGAYSSSRQWSLVLSQWADTDGLLDGLLYPSRHDDTQRCLALFSRAADAIAIVSHEKLEHRRRDILALRAKYRFPLDLDA
jgi:RES domain